MDFFLLCVIGSLFEVWCAFLSANLYSDVVVFFFVDSKVSFKFVCGTYDDE